MKILIVALAFIMVDQIAGLAGFPHFIHPIEWADGTAPLVMWPNQWRFF